MSSDDSICYSNAKLDFERTSATRRTCLVCLEYLKRESERTRYILSRIHTTQDYAAVVETDGVTR